MKSYYYDGTLPKKNQKKIKPVSKYDGECVNTGLCCKIIK